MSGPVSVYNDPPEHRAELIDAAKNEIKCFSPVSLQSIRLRFFLFRAVGSGANRRKIGRSL